MGYIEFVVTDPSCLQDCFSSDPSHPSYCLHLLLGDVVRNGMCLGGTHINYTLSNKCILGDNDKIIAGTCSKETEASLMTEKCFRNGYEQQFPIQNSVMLMIGNSCSSQIEKNWRVRVNNLTNVDFFTDNRINPVTNIGEGFKTQIPYENTRNRYPWICSLRTHGINPEHLCAVTLLSIPPRPTILIGPAHCTLICKDKGKKMPSCCCITEGVESCRSDLAKCGKDALVSEMIPEEVDILCGDWEIGPVPMQMSKEKYNIILPVEQIIVHGKYDKQKGPTKRFDIALFIVNDQSLKDARSKNIYPICLPAPNRDQPAFGIQSGWAPPPPYYFAIFFPSLKLHFEDLFKQFHYKMEILKRCEDPKSILTYGRDLKYPSNTSYPAGVVCAKDFKRHCFSSGDSGSPLMSVDKKISSRFYLEGVVSYTKGCEFNKISFRRDFKIFYGVNQENPTVFTKISCYLPWVAKHYGLTYDHISDTVADKRCTLPTGDPDDVKKNICRETIGDFTSEERECIFPFYFEGELKYECILQTFDYSDTIPDGMGGMCLGSDGKLDPLITKCETSKRIPPLVRCKNNCRWGE